ncbi:TPA: hypothetical protein RXK68_004496 [Escherichia coli]|nr:hypothetical protein [Escherichia coli]
MIDDFEFDVGDRFTYEYNFFEHWIHDIRVEAIYKNTELKTPFCISGHGMPGATVADEFDKTLAFLEAIYLGEATEHHSGDFNKGTCSRSVIF